MPRAIAVNADVIIKIDGEYAQRLRELAATEERSASGQGRLLIKQALDDYKRPASSAKPSATGAGAMDASPPGTARRTM